MKRPKVARLSMTERKRSTALSWMTTEIRLRTSSGSWTGSKPSTLIRPDVGRSSVVSIFSVVVLPAPFGPSRPKIDPRRTEKVSPSTARSRAARGA